MRIGYNEILSDETKQNIIKDYTDNKLSLREIKAKYDIKSSYFIDKLLKGKTRSLSEANKLARIKNPSAYKITDEIKERMRIARYKYIREYPEKTVWAKRTMSYPEKCFQKFLEENGYDKKFLIVREHPIFPYFIDFAFIDEKIAVEIDGIQHTFPERKESDIKKDALLREQGWKVLRFSERIVKTDWKIIKDELDKYINLDDYELHERVGILKHQPKKGWIKKERDANGRTKDEIERILKRRKVERPSKEELIQLISQYSILELGKQFGVSDTAIRKWLKWEGLPFRTSEIKSFLNENNIEDKRNRKI